MVQVLDELLGPHHSPVPNHRPICCTYLLPTAPRIVLQSRGLEKIVRDLNLATDPSNNAGHLETDNDSRVATILGDNYIENDSCSSSTSLLKVFLLWNHYRLTILLLIVVPESWLGHPRSSTRSRTRAFKQARSTMWGASFSKPRTFSHDD